MVNSKRIKILGIAGILLILVAIIFINGRDLNATLSIYVVTEDANTSNLSAYKAVIDSSSIKDIKFNEENGTILIKLSDAYLKANAENKPKWSASYTAPYIGEAGGSLLLNADSRAVVLIVLGDEIIGKTHLSQPIVSSFFPAGLITNDTDEGLLISSTLSSESAEVKTLYEKMK